MVLLAVIVSTWSYVRCRRKVSGSSCDNVLLPAYAISHEKEAIQGVELDGQQTFTSNAYNLHPARMKYRLCKLNGRWEGSEMQAKSTTPTLQRKFASDETEPTIVSREHHESGVSLRY